MEVRAGNEGSNLEAETDAKAMEEHILLVCSPWLAKLAFLYNPKPSNGEHLS